MQPRESEEKEEFLAALYPTILGTLRISGVNDHTAEDVTQEALTRAIERWDRVGRMDNPHAWIAKTAMNLSISRWRRSKNEAIAAARAAASREEPAQVEDLVGAEDHVLELLSLLPLRQRQAIALRFYADFDVATAAQVMRCRPSTVRALTHQALSKLRELGITSTELED